MKGVFYMSDLKCWRRNYLRSSNWLIGYWSSFDWDHRCWNDYYITIWNNSFAENDLIDSIDSSKHWSKNI